MKPGQSSRTAELVCMGRALAHGATTAGAFSDPTAFPLLSAEARARVDRLRAQQKPRGLRDGATRAYFERQSKLMVARTVAIDDAIHEAASPQLVILGAGLDGRAYRMAELRDAVVFEVDHPDSQREKRARVGSLVQAARDVRFVAVDFERDDLEAALARAGHDLQLPTTWVWEGVVMYLAPADIAATLKVVARRSAPESRLVVLYHSPAFMLRIVGLIVRAIGEPLRSSFTAEAMRTLLAEHGFEVTRDQDVHAIGAALSPDIGLATKPIRHMRIVTADRR